MGCQLIYARTGMPRILKSAGAWLSVISGRRCWHGAAEAGQPRGLESAA